MCKLLTRRRALAAALALILSAGLLSLTRHDSGRSVTSAASTTAAERPAATAAANRVPRRDSRSGGVTVGREESAHLEAAFAELPLSFEQNAGQFDRSISFAARGDGYSVSLKPTGLEISLRAQSQEAVDAAPPSDVEGSPILRERASSRRAAGRIAMKMRGANPAPRVTGVKRQGGVSNYFVGRDQSAWRTNVPNFARVEYASVYPGVDLVYYGNRRRLEYDFRVAAGADPRRIELEFEGVEALRLEADGDLVLRAEGGGELRQHRPVSYQMIGGARREVESRYALSGDRRAVFELGDYDPNHSLVIDPVLSYSTFLGGDGPDLVRAVALGQDGSIYVTGRSQSADLPTTRLGLPNSGASIPNAFVLKLNPAGTAIVYGAYIGGEEFDEGLGIAVDAGGDAFVTGFTASAEFPVTPGALQRARGGMDDAFAVRLNASGTDLVYSTYLGGPSFDYGFGLALDATGHAHVVGESHSARFINGAPMPKRGSPVYKTTDAAAGWRPAASGFDDGSATAFAIHPTDPNIIYAGSDSGVYKTTDGGATWRLTGSGHPTDDPIFVTALALDPASPSTLYVGTSGTGVHVTFDGGANYFVFSNFDFDISIIHTLAAHPTQPHTVYVGTSFGAYRSTSGGASWTEMSFQLNETFPQQVRPLVNWFAFDPTNPSITYAATEFGVFKTTDGGANWAQSLNSITGLFVFTVRVDPAAPSVVYAGTNAGPYKSTDGGASWQAINAGLERPDGLGSLPVGALAIDPASPSVLYAAGLGVGIYKTTDGGATWAPSGAGISNREPNLNALELDRTNPATVYAGFASGADAFVVRLDPSGAAADYSLYLGGDEGDTVRGVAADAAGNLYIVGATRSHNFPVASPIQAAQRGAPDAFVTKLSPAGAILYSTYLGGAHPDFGRGIAVDSSGRAHVTGYTHSPNFPVAGPRQTALNEFGPDLFVARLGPAGSSLDYSVLHGGGRDEQGLAIALDPAGGAYVTGFTTSPDFPLVNPVLAVRAGFQHAFVLKLGPASEVLYSTYLGASSSERGLGIAADASGSAYVVGTTSSADFPLVSPLRATYENGEGFLARLSDSPPCTFAVAPGSFSFGAAGAVGVVNVTTTANCAWSATSNADWITITSGFAGQGNGAVNFAVAAHTGSAQRSGTLTVAGQTVTVTQLAAPPAVQFAPAVYEVSESAGRVTLTVTRTGDTSAAVTVGYQTTDSDTFTVGCADAAGAQGNAFARCDFATAVGTLTFAAGEAAKIITVPLIDDAHAEGAEIFRVRLINPAGASLGAQNFATVTIFDNDAGGAQNPVSGPPYDFFVRQQYLDFLSREPDPGGFNAWLGVLNTCQPNAHTGPQVQSGCDRIHVSGEGFFRSTEFRLKGGYAFRFYKVAFSRLPEYLELISDMSFVAGATSAEVFARRAQLAVRFTERQEFTNAYGTLGNDQYVAALLGRYSLQQVTTPDPANPDGDAKVTLTGAELTNRLSAGTLTRAQVLRAVADSDEVGALEFDNTFVAMQYYGYLRRKPEPGGYEAWLRVLRSGDVRTMVDGFLNSAEYRLRFGAN